MESKKQSSIEWLMNELSFENGLGVRHPSHSEFANLNEYFEKAKEIHKQEIIDACEEFGNLNGVDIEDYIEYYNQTFNQQ